MKRKIEVCCTSLKDVREAAAGGAVRVELCSAISCGGVTPSHGLIRQAVTEALRSPGSLVPADTVHAMPHGKTRSGSRLTVNVLIRPREGSFCYTESEVETMLEDIRFCHEAGADGVVIGALTPDGEIDMEACIKMMEAARGMSVTFHRAFDVCRNPEQAIEQIIGLGCDRLLSSGQKPSALEGAQLLASLVKRAAGRIIIMPGSGINPENIAEIERITKASEFHSTARAAVPDPCLRHVPELGFDEAPAHVSPACSGSVQTSMTDSRRFILRTSRTVVRQLVSTSSGSRSEESNQ